MRLRFLTGFLLLVLALRANAVEARRFDVYAVWLDEVADDDRASVELFLPCLLEHSTFPGFWRGAARFAWRGSTRLPRAAVRDGAGEITAEAVARAAGFALPPDGTPVFVLFGSRNAVEANGCGRSQLGTLGGRPAGLALVRTYPTCWPGDLVRTATQISEHELAEVVDGMLGHAMCGPDGACEGRGRCANPCDAFTGLSCPGAPAETLTGCDATPVTGWVVQRLSHKSWAGSCAPCQACDYTVEASERGAEPPAGGWPPLPAFAPPASSTAIPTWWMALGTTAVLIGASSVARSWWRKKCSASR